MTAILWSAAAVVAGYALGRLRPLRRASNWAACVHVTGRWEQRRYRWPAYAVMVVGIAAHPVRSYRNLQSWRKPTSRRTTDKPLQVNRPHREDTDHATR